MSNPFELHVLRQIYDFIIERDSFKNLSPHNQVLEFFREINEGDKSDVVEMSPNIIHGKFGFVSKINLTFVPMFKDKDKFLKWVHQQLN